MVNRIYTTESRYAFGDESAIDHGVFVQGSSYKSNWRIQPHSLLDTVLEVLQRLQVFPGGRGGGGGGEEGGIVVAKKERDRQYYTIKSHL